MYYLKMCFNVLFQREEINPFLWVKALCPQGPPSEVKHCGAQGTEVIKTELGPNRDPVQSPGGADSVRQVLTQGPREEPGVTPESAWGRG